MLVAARTVQGVAGAAVVCAALGLLAAVTGADAPAARIWAFAGILGAACGPAAGGILTQLFGWESIFVVQAPLLLLSLVALYGVRFTPTLRPLERPHLGANAALMLVSGALVAALFLLVILLINGWRLDPLQAGAVVPPQVAIGAGLGLALSALTERALAGRASQVLHGGWTLAARHAGVVLGLLLLTPIFTADLERNGDEALAAGTAYVLDSRIPPLEKIGVAREILAAVDDAEAEARVPDVGQIVTERGDEPAYTELAGSLQDQLDRAATNAFSRSFLAAALLGLAALVPILLDRRDVSL